MSIRKLPLFAPRLPAPDFFQEPTNTIRTADGAALIAYCPVTRCGLVYEFADRRWTSTSPVSFAEFGVLVSDMGLEFTPSEEVSAWVKACSRDSAAPESPVAH